MELDRYGASDKQTKRSKRSYQNELALSESYPVSRFGALLAASLIRLPGDVNRRVIEKYFTFFLR